jgi:hypothetical protein
MDPFTSPALRAAAAALATAAATGTLAHLAKLWGSGRWPALTALLLGPDDPDKGDLRFAAVVASVGSGLAWVVALDQTLQRLSPTGRAAGIALGFPLIALAVTSLADVASRRWAELTESESERASESFVESESESDAESETETEAGSPSVAKALNGVLPAGTQEALRVAIRAGSAVAGAAATVATDPRVQAAASAAAGAALRGGSAVLKATASAVVESVGSPKRAPSPEERDRVRRLIDEALGEVGAARARTDDSSIREALASMEEALSGYAQVVDDVDADLDRISVRCREVMALARSCEDDGADAFRTLGLRRDATLEQARRVYHELAKIYHTDTSADGVDDDRFKEITVAYERVRAVLEN